MDRIGVFDSGIGGLSTLSAIMRELGGGDFVYLADDKNAPFGIKSDVELLKIGREGISTLVNLGCKHVVIACNTMTATCKSRLVEEYDINIIGTEPALMPAIKECTRVALLATPATIGSSRVQELLLKCRGQVTSYPNCNLAGIIEGVAPDWDIMKEYVKKNCQYLSDYDGLVLGCTHYVHIKESFSEVFPHLKIYDGNDGVARRLATFVKKANTTNIRIYTTSRAGESRYQGILGLKGKKNKKGY